MMIQLIMAFLATLGFTVLFNAPKTELVFCGLTGALGWLVYLAVARWFEQGLALPGDMALVAATFVSAVAVTALSRFLAGLRKMPVTLFLVAGIIPLVPGAGIYDTMYALILNETAAAAMKGLAAFKTAGLIGLGIMIVFSLPERWFRRHKGYRG